MVWYVNEEEIPEEQIKEEADRLRPEYERVFAEMAEDEREKQLLDWSRENVIERELLRQAAWREGEDIPAEEIDKAFEDIVERCGGREKFDEQIGAGEEKEKEVRHDIEQGMRVERLIEKISSQAPAPSEEEMHAFYDENIERFTTPEMVRAAHIVKHLGPGSEAEEAMETLKKVRKQLRNNAYFGDMVVEHSDCPDNGGDLGYFPRGQMVPEFEDVVFNMKVGELSDVFETEFGYHIAKVTDKRSPSVQEFDKVKDNVEEQLQGQLRQEAIEKFLDAEKEQANIGEK